VAHLVFKHDHAVEGHLSPGTRPGHASITITLDRYGHLLPGSESEAAALLDAYFERANTQARTAALA
jgi:hypothetical protein